MSSRDQHTGDGAINTEEHIGEGGVNRKAVGLFARDALGTGAFELSAISTASGAVLSTTPASISSSANLGNVTLNPSPNFIGIVTVANPGAAGMSTLFGGPNQIGSVTISGTPTVFLGTPTIFAVVNTGAVGNTNSLTTLLAGPNQIGSVTISHVVSVAQSGTWDEVGINDSGNSITVDGTVTADAGSGTFNTAFTHLVSLASGTEVKSVATVVAGATFPVSGTFFQATQPVSFGLVSLASGTEIRSLATVLNFPATQNVALTHLVSLASGTEIRSLSTVLNPELVGKALPQTALVSTASGNRVNAWFDNTGLQGVFGYVTIYPRTDYIGLVSISGNVVASGTVGISGLVSLASGTEVRSLTTILPRTDYIGLVSVSGNVAVSNTVAVTQSGTWDEVGINDSGNSITVDGSVGVTGLISLASGTEVRSLATLLNQPPLVASTAYIGLVSVFGNVNTTHFSNVTLNASNAFIGLATTVNGAGNQYIGLVTNTIARGMTTSFATIYSGAGNYTLFQPPASQRWFVHNLMVNAMGISEGTIKSGTALRWPWAGLATYGGFAKTFDNPGLPATAVNDAFVVTLNSGATVSVDVGVHFEA